MTRYIDQHMLIQVVEEMLLIIHWQIVEALKRIL